MKRLIFIVFVALLASTTVSAEEFTEADTIDREMIELLELRSEQIPQYTGIMQTQRTAFLALQPHQWQEQLAVYEETIELLKSILDATQHAKFITVLGCLIEESQPPTYVAEENSPLTQPQLVNSPGELKYSSNSTRF